MTTVPRPWKAHPQPPDCLNEKREGNESDLTANYMDLALPIQRGGQDYIIYILDQRATVRESTVSCSS